MVKFEGKIGTLYQIFTPCTHCKFCMMFKRKGGGGGAKGFLNNVKKSCTFLAGWLPLEREGGGSFLVITKFRHRPKSTIPLQMQMQKRTNFPFDAIPFTPTGATQ